MSYVLEALKRAEAERRRGGVPDLQAQQSLPAPEDDLPPRRPRLAWRGIGAAVALLVAAGLGAWWAQPPEAPPPAIVAQPREPAPVPTAPPAPPPPAPLPAPPIVVPPPAPPIPSPAAVAPPQPTRPPPPAVAAAPRPAPAPSPSAAVAPATAPAAAPPAAAATSAPAERLPSLAELPEALRRELPTLAVGGAMYSEQPAQRMLVLNGQVLRERDTVAPGLVLEQIRLRSAVMNYKGQRWLLGW